MVHDLENVLARGSQTGADGSAAEVHDAQPLLAFVNAPAVTVNGFGIRAHFAAERRQDGILKLRAANFNDVRKLFLRRLKCLLQGNDFFFQGL